MSRKPRVEAVATHTYRVEGEFPCALYDGESSCSGMTNQKNFCHGCGAYICPACDETGVEGEHHYTAHQRKN
jgi:hypothetical protein